MSWAHLFNLVLLYDISGLSTFNLFHYAVAILIRHHGGCRWPDANLMPSNVQERFSRIKERFFEVAGCTFNTSDEIQCYVNPHPPGYPESRSSVWQPSTSLVMIKQSTKQHICLNHFDEPRHLSTWLSRYTWVDAKLKSKRDVIERNLLRVNDPMIRRVTSISFS